MPGPESSSNGPAVAAQPPVQAPPHAESNGFDNLAQPQYPSLAFPPAGPSQPQPQYPPSGGWQHAPYYMQQYPPHPGAGQPRPQANGGGGFQPGYRYDHGYQAYPYPPYYMGYGHVPVPGPGPGTMQNGYYMPPNYQRPYPVFDGSEGGPPVNGDDSGFNHNGMPFQPQTYYPPGHPYAYGGGVGYQQHMPFNGANGFRPDVYMPDQHGPTMHTTGKALNPAAQGFNYHARKGSATANGSVSGRDGSSREPTEVASPGPAQLEAGGGSLGLSLEPPAPSAIEVPQPIASEESKAESAVPPVVDEEIKEKESSPERIEPEPTVAVVPEVEAAIKFTGPTIPGYSSPKSSNSLHKPKASDPIPLRPSRPTPEEAIGNSYASHLAGAIPENMATETMDGESRKRSSRGRDMPWGKAVYAIGVKGGRTAPPIDLVFGEISDKAQTPAPAAVLLPPADTAVAAPVTPALAPAPVSKPKTSWAALFSPKKSSGTPDSLSVAASSTLPSPSKSIASLPSEVAPSQASASDEATTPRSAAPSLPASTSGQPRAPFNYAAAAAAGAPPTPAEDLARLLTDGLRPRAAHVPAPVVPRGLVNTGNMCFANTILQVLVYCTPFTELLDELGKRLKADLARRSPLLEAMIGFLHEFTPGPSTSGTATPRGKLRESKDAFVPENVYDAMKENKRFDSMRRGFQEDAEEYLGFFLNTLHEELLGLYSRIQPPRSVTKPAVANGSAERTINRPVSPGAGGGDNGDDWLEVGKKQKTHVVRQAESKESSVSRTFGGTLRSVLHTAGQKDSITLEPYQPLQLDVQDPKVVTIADALRHLNEPETVGGVWSASRGANVDATKQVYIDSFPPVLILHLKRFVYDPQEQNVVKRDKPVAYGSELVIPQEIISAPKRTNKPITYRLFGVVYHHGRSATGGHYTVSVARPDGTGWLHFDDETVQPVPAEDVVVSEEEARDGRAGQIGGRERSAYLLFYQRIR